MWRVYRIRTANSAYELEVQADGASSGRRCAVMTCVEPAHREGEAFEDSAPVVNGDSLFSLSPLEWIGRRLTIGTACTSEIQSVDFVRDASTCSLPRSARAPVTPPQPPAWAPFPLGSVEMVEAAASVLKAVCHQRDLRAHLEHDRRLVRRLELALAECGLMVETLSDRGR